MHKLEILHFTLGGLQLQEPSTFITDWLVAFYCFFVCFKIYRMHNYENNNFYNFYLFLGLSTFFGGLGHLFFHYTGIVGKFPSWITASVASYHFCKAMMADRQGVELKWVNLLIIFKALFLLGLSIIFQKFIFIALDSILSYLIFGGVLGSILWKNTQLYMRFVVYGTLLLIPTAFVFILDVNLHILFNRDDFSHMLILISSMLFYKAIAERNTLRLAS